MSTTTMSQTELYKTMRTMAEYGGNFCRCLAEAWYAGDSRNRARIEMAFPHLLQRYGPESTFYNR